MKIDGRQLLREVCDSLNINLVQLIAKTSIWANPKVIEQLKMNGDNQTALWRKECRRYRLFENRREIGKDGCFLDDNTIASNAIKTATGGFTKQNTFVACHIYPGSCYDKNYHTSICNLVLLPKEIYSLTDNDEDVINALKYRSFELYDFFIGEAPLKPDNYHVLQWRDPESFSVRIMSSINKRKFM